MFYRQAPVGDRISLEKSSIDEVDGLFPGYDVACFDSGTSSLAAAVIIAARSKEVSRPEVMLPAYCCPDVVSAVVHAGAHPVLVDLAPDRPWMDLAQVRDRISPSTVAIIAINFLGLPERLSQLRDICRSERVLLIEDSAQALPSCDDEHGDLIVMSFGRGKPVSLLGGGMLLSKPSDPAVGMPVMEPTGGFISDATFPIKVLMYNVLLSPYVYWLPASLPFLGLGETHYDPLDGISGMARTRLGRLSANIRRIRSRDDKIQKSVGRIIDGAGSEHVIDLPRVCGIGEGVKLLRYPILVADERRGALEEMLLDDGVGVSELYAKPLVEISGLERLASQGEFQEASRFAERLLTIAVHPRVNASDLESLQDGLSSL